MIDGIECAYPYTGCQHGCRFCYCRERKHCPCDDPADFEALIRAKVNAPALLRRALQRVPLDLVATGDYLPCERMYPLGSNTPVSESGRKIPQRNREPCREAGIGDRIPRPVIPGKARALSKRTVESLPTGSTVWNSQELRQRRPGPAAGQRGRSKT